MFFADKIAESLKARGIYKANWEFYLDDMTDEEMYDVMSLLRQVLAEAV